MSETRGSVLRTRRMRARYLVARNHPAPETVRARLDAAARSSLGDLGRAIASVTEADNSIWFIRYLEIELPIDAAWESSRIAATWARHIASAVKATIARGPDGDAVVRFADRVEHLGCLMVELARATAWSRWYFARFDGLRLLPPSAAIRSVIVETPDLALTALLRLPTTELRLVIEALSPADALRAARGLGGGARSTTALDDARRAALKISSIRVASEERAVFEACIECARDIGSVTGAHVDAIRAIQRLRVNEITGGGERAAAVLRALATGNVAAIARVASIGDAETLAPLMGESETALAGLLQASGPVFPKEDPAGPRDTRFGGLFLLLPSIIGLPVDSATADWPDCAGTPASNVVRFLAALAAASGDVRRDWNDPVARDVLAIAPAVALEQAASWTESITDDRWRSLCSDLECDSPSAADLDFLTLPPAFVGSVDAASSIAALGHNLLRRFAASLTGFARSSATHLFANFLNVRASVEDEPMRRVVRIGNPPLGLVLRMAGVVRGAIVVPWLDERPFMFFPWEDA